MDKQLEILNTIKEAGEESGNRATYVGVSLCKPHLICFVYGIKFCACSSMNTYSVLLCSGMFKHVHLLYSCVSVFNMTLCTIASCTGHYCLNQTISKTCNMHLLLASDKHWGEIGLGMTLAVYTAII